jgi:biopolymer transport protein ExbD
MIITPLMAKQLSVNVPVKPDPNEPEPGPGAETQVVLRVDPAGQVFVNQESVDDKDLPHKLKRVFAARRDQTLFFDAADALAYGRAVEVLDLARGTGIVTIAVLTEELTE